MSDFPRCTWIGAPVARVPARAGARATRSVGMLLLDFPLPAYLIVAPVAWASAHAGGMLAYHVRQVGGPAAAGPRFFVLCGHGVGAAGGRVEGRRRASALWAPERSEGKDMGGTTGGSQVGHPCPQ